MKQQRYTNMDMMRVIACFFVLFVHCMTSVYYSLPLLSPDWKAINLYFSTGRNTVPMFFMLSGMLILSRENYSLKKLFTKNIPKIVLLFFLWSAFYAVDNLGIKNVIFDFDLKALLKEMLSFKYHLWYLPSLVVVYWMVPVLRGIRNDQQVLKYCVLMFFIFAIIRTTLSIIPQLAPLCTLISRFGFSFASGVGYFILGYVLYTNQDKIRLSNLALLAILVDTTLLAAVVNYFICAWQKSALDTVYDVFTLPSFIESCAGFLLFLRIPSEKIDEKINRKGWIQRLAKYALVIYLVHPFVIEQLENRFGITATFIHPLLGAPILALVVFAICLLIAFVIDLIPGVRKILL